MHLLHVVPSFVPAWRYGGPVKAVDELSRALARRDLDVRVYTTDIDGPDNLDVPLDEPVEREGVTTRYFRARSPRSYTFSPHLARGLARDVSKFDLVHVHSALNWPTTVAARIADRNDVPYLIRPCGILEHTPFHQPYEDGWRGRLRRWKKRAYLELVERTNLENAARLHLTSEGEREAIDWIGTSTDIAIHPLGVQPPDDYPSPSTSRDALAEEHDLDPDRTWLLFLSRLDPKKGLDRLIAALPELEADTDELHLLVAGSGPDDHEAKLRRLVDEKDLHDTVEFLGFVEDEAKLRTFRASDVFVLPTHQENFGIAVAEAMDAQLPVVVTPGVDIHPYVSDHEAGRIGAWKDEYLEELDQLLAEPETWGAMGKRGRDLVRTVFDWDRIAEELEATYEEILAEVQHDRDR